MLEDLEARHHSGEGKHQRRPASLPKTTDDSADKKATRPLMLEQQALTLRRTFSQTQWRLTHVASHLPPQLVHSIAKAAGAPLNCVGDIDKTSTDFSTISFNDRERSELQ
jgi:hypothetical protein